MFRRSLFDSIGGYRNECEFWEDLDFAIRASKEARILVLPEPLYRYRQSTLSTRIASDQRRVENALDLRYRSIGLLRRDGTYDDLPRAGGEKEQRIDPRVFVSLGLLSLWSSRRPAMLGRFFKRARLRLDAATIIAIVWLGWASISPATVRFLMNLVSRCRNAAIRPRIAGNKPVEWKPAINRGARN